MKYVPEINGLRALAVLAVFLFHLNIAGFSGGFVGVDAFFVISGYLITSNIGTDLARGRFSFREFYVRRVLRILPALYVVSIGIALVFSLLFPPTMSARLLGSMFAGLLSYSNVWFYFTVDYFGVNLTEPTLHYWSLAVEEQFYLLMPLLFWLAWKRGGRHFASGLFGALFAASLLAASYVVAKDQAQAFYLPWLRAWELLGGSLLAFVPRERLTLRVRRSLAEVGLLALLATIFLYDEKGVFPGFSALPPVLATMALIAGADSRSLAGWVLKTQPAQWLGKISYSLYLVHWPVICMIGLVFALSTKYKFGIILISVGLAWMSWRFVELRFRFVPGQFVVRKVFVRTGVWTATCALIFTVASIAGMRLWENHPQAIAYATVDTDLSYFNRNTCFLTSQSDGLRYYRQDLCLQPSRQRENVLVIGDSHAANIVEALKRHNPAVKVLQATAVGCRPLLGNRGAKRCTDLVDFIYREWYPRNASRIHKVVLAGRWENDDLGDLDRSLAALKAFGASIIVYGPVPEYMVPVPLLLAYQEIAQIPLSVKLQRPDRRTLDAVLRQRLGTDAVYFSPYLNLCSGTDCKLEDGGAAVYIDRDHLTPRGADIAVRGMPIASLTARVAHNALD
jgi:peptidoglycan/LPS O-acetylase OafA/YrhL